MIEIKYGQLRKIAFILLAIPFFIFAIGWLRWYWSIVCVAAIGICLYFALFKDNEFLFEENTIEISWVTLFIIMAIALIWVWQSGIGGFWAQSEDFRYRNAIFRDIVIRNWPVIYPATGHALVYYIGYWLFPALLGKLALLFGADQNVAFSLADTALFIWTFFIIMIVFLLILYTLKLSDRKKQIFVIALFILFSGADIIGSVGYTWKSIDYHFEWWAADYQYSSFTTCLFWVFNQALPAWLCIMCLINEKSIKNYVFLGMMCLFCAPLPFVGVFVFCIFFAVKKLIDYLKQESLKAYLKSLFSVSNILSILFIFPIIGTYLLSNYAIQGANSLRMNDAVTGSQYVEVFENVASAGESGANSQNIPFSNNPVVNYFSFICIEFALFMIFMAWKYKKSAIYYVTFASLLIIPLLKIGGKHDFSMRASVPAIVLVFLMVAKFLIEENKVIESFKKAGSKKKKDQPKENTSRGASDSIKRLTYIMLIVFLILGSLTPAMEFLRGFHEVSEYGIHNEKYDDIFTLGCDGPNDKHGEKITYGNFVCINPDENIFFKVFAGKR